MKYAVHDVLPGQEQYQEYWSSVLKKQLVQYDYRAEDGELFSCIAKTLDAARARRDEWLKKRGGASDG